MEERIEVEKELRESRNHEHFRHFFISIIGVVVPISLWAFYYGKIESRVWWGFFTVVTLLVAVVSFTYGFIKIRSTSRAMTHYRDILTKYANIDERTHIPQTAVITTCLRKDMGRFGFQNINYFFWIDATELVFFPVRPEFLTSKAYQLVQSVRLNEVMVRSFSLIGTKYNDGLKDAHENIDPIENLKYGKSAKQPIYRDTRATLISYAVGEQTVYLAFDASLYDRLKQLLPNKDKMSIEANKQPVDLIVPEVIVEPTAEIPES